MGSSGSSGLCWIFWLLHLPQTLAWRSECDIEGLDVKIIMHGSTGAGGDESKGVTAHGASRQCRVAFLNADDMDHVDISEVVASSNVVFTDSLRHVPFAGRNGPLRFLDNISLYLTENFDEVMANKKRLLSILLPPSSEWDELAAEIHRQASSLMPSDIFIDDGTLEVHIKAFEPYRFSLIADDLGRAQVSQPFIHSMGVGTIPVFNGFVDLGAMFFNGIADFDPEDFSLTRTLDIIKSHNEQLGALWHYHRMIQDQLQYRYNRPFEERLLSQACSACRLQMVAKGRSPLVFVGIYSARANFEKRQSVRETWLRILRDTYGARYRFFLGEGSSAASVAGARLRAELEEHDDIVFLPATEGYRMNSRKGILFLEWVAENTAAEYLLKVDDDIYFRPAPLLRQLLLRSPTAYAWGLFDYISPVPEDPADNFYNTKEDFPFEVFPPYPRGVVRVLSMDIVRLLAEANRQGRLRFIFGDDPCLGLHLRQLLFDPEEPLPSLTLDDFDSNRVFAMEPSCRTLLWSKITARTWVVHHVRPEQVRCMWNADVAGGYYKELPRLVGLPLVQADESFPLDGFPDLCGCVTESDFENRTDMQDIQRETAIVLSKPEIAALPGEL